MKMIVRRMRVVVDRMAELKDAKIRPPVERPGIFDDECWSVRSSVETEDEILPVTVWPDSVVRH